MSSQKLRSFTKYAFFKTSGASFALLFLCSCTSAVYDMRQLDQPVVLNNNPCLISRTTASPKLVKIDGYSATVNNSESDANQTNTTSGVNTAQLNAFLKIGGEPDCSIRNVTLDTECGGYYFVFLACGEGADIEATGEVAQIQASLARAIGKMGQSPTDQSALPSSVQK